MNSNRGVDPKFFYQKPKLNFGEILNASLIISRDVNKDLMTHTQKYSEVRSLSKNYPHKPLAPLGFKPPMMFRKL